VTNNYIRLGLTEIGKTKIYWDNIILYSS